MTNRPDLSQRVQRTARRAQGCSSGRLHTADPPLPEPDLLDGYRLALLAAASGRRRLRLGRQGRPDPVRRHRPVPEVGRRQLRRVLPIAPVDPARTYRVTGNRGDSVYLSMTVYGGPDDGRYSDRIVGTMNDRALAFDDDGQLRVHDEP